MYIAYLKFGFSRATTDTSIEIRHQRLERKSAIKIVKKKDHIFPSEFLNKYLKYFKIEKKIFIKILRGKLNRKLFKDSKNIFNIKLAKFD